MTKQTSHAKKQISHQYDQWSHVTKQTAYVHGYSEKENDRLVDQGKILNQAFHNDIRYPDNSSVLEAGCGVGAQTVSLLTNSPGARFTCIDLSAESVAEAQKRTAFIGHKNVTFQQADIFNLPFEDQQFDHIFVCFVLEHLPNPETALQKLKAKLKKGGTITVIEGDHGSTFFHPKSDKAWQTIQCLIDLQADMGGDSLIGRRLYPLLSESFQNVAVTPVMIYADAGRPDYVTWFTENTYIAMVKGVREKAIAQNKITAKDWDAGINDLKKTASQTGTFSYTFFKAVGHH